MTNMVKNGRAHVIEMANRATVQKLAGESLSGLTSRLDNHESSLNSNSHIIGNIAGLQTELNGKASTSHTHTISNITGLQVELDEKADISDVNAALSTKADMFTGYTGTLVVVKTVNFVAQTSTTATINISNGIIVSIT